MKKSNISTHHFCLQYFVLTVLACFFLRCTKDNYSIDEDGSILTKINYSNHDQSWEENYKYSFTGQLIEVENFQSLERGDRLVYQDSILTEIITTNLADGELVFIDSFIYNTAKQLYLIKHFSTNSIENLALSTVDTFKYDISGQIKEKVTYFASSQDVIYKQKYHWDGANIDRVEHFDKEDELLHEFFYKYDDKINYKKLIGIYFKDPINWTNNNITEMAWNDYSGLLDMLCRPCITKYEYNRNNYPVRISQSWWADQELVYATENSLLDN